MKKTEVTEIISLEDIGTIFECNVEKWSNIYLYIWPFSNIIHEWVNMKAVPKGFGIFLEKDSH